MGKPVDGRKIIEQAKEKVNNKKENKDMKKPIIITVVVTLVTVMAFIATFIGGMKYQENQNNQVKAEAAAIVKNVKVEATVTPSK